MLRVISSPAVQRLREVVRGGLTSAPALPVERKGRKLSREDGLLRKARRKEKRKRKTTAEVLFIEPLLRARPWAECRAC